MDLIACRDCGRAEQPEPDDPAPNLCADCYSDRLAQVAEKFPGMAASLDSPPLIAMWLEEALVEIGGETREAAHYHAGGMLYAYLTGEMPHG
jgi:hypothetical protein